MLKSKQRKLDRLSDENESLLGQVDTYCAQLKDAKNSDVKAKHELQKVQEELNKASQECKAEKKKAAELEKEVKSAKSKADQLTKELEGEKSKRNKLEAAAAKGMEAEANLICLKENEREASRKIKDLEGLLAMEKKLNADKNLQLAALSDKLLQAETLAHQMEEKAELLAAESKDEDKCQENILEERTKLVNEMEDIKAKFSQLEADNAEKQERLEQMELSKSAATEEWKAVEQKNRGLIEELNQLTEEMKRRGERIDRLEQCTVDHQNRARELEKQKTELEAKAIEVSSKLEDSEKKQRELEKTHSDLRQELKNQVEVLESSKQAERLKEAEFSDLLGKLKESEKTKKEALEEMEGINREVTCLKDQIASLSNYLEVKQKEVSTLEDKLEIAAKEKDANSSSADSKIQELENLLAQKGNDSEQLSLTNKLKEADEAVGIQSLKVKDLTLTLEGLQTSLKTLKEENKVKEENFLATFNDLESKNTSHVAEVDSLTNDLSEKEKKIKQLNSVIERMVTREEAEIKEEQDIEKVLEEKAALEIELDSLTKDLAKVKEHLKEVIQEKSDLNEEKDMMVAEKNNILKDMEEVTQEKEQLRNQMTRLVKDHTLGEEHLAASEAKIQGKLILKVN